MKVFIRSFFCAVCLLSVSFFAYGQTEQEPNCNCKCNPGDKTLYSFESYFSSSHEQFYCEFPANTAPNAIKVRLYNRAEKVKGFDSDGKLKIKTKKLNKLYFDAYHDWKYIHCKGVVCSSEPNIQCFKGTGSGRELIDGSYGGHS
jgi:hypothetical protein